MMAVTLESASPKGKRGNDVTKSVNEVLTEKLMGLLATMDVNPVGMQPDAPYPNAKMKPETEPMLKPNLEGDQTLLVPMPKCDQG